ncbi:MAG: hypothetical protein ACQESK_04680 [Bacteroidota bacterium]
MYYFKKCLKLGFNESKEIKSVLKEDKSGASDFALGIENYRLLDSLAEETSKKIKTDSVQSLSEAHQSAQGKKVFENCLCNFNGNLLDSIAKSKL